MCIYISPPSGTYLFPVLCAFGFKFPSSIGYKEYCTMFVPVSRFHLHKCVYCVMVLPVVVT